MAQHAKTTQLLGVDFLFLLFWAASRRPSWLEAPLLLLAGISHREKLRFRDHDGSPYDGIKVEYIDPTTGRTPYPTMTFFGQLLRPGEKTRPQRQNASMVCVPFHGSGHSIVGGKRLDWKPFDAIALPGGEWFEHVNGSDKDDAILFLASDEPTLAKLGFLQKFGKTETGEVVRIT